MRSVASADVVRHPGRIGVLAQGNLRENFLIFWQVSRGEGRVIIEILVQIKV